ncbi:MAG TPA: PEP-CTERM sorting domain-containing protein [Acetobacteraceae bacterium]
MSVPFRKSFYIASTALSLSLAGFAAKADPALPNLVNLTFTNYTGSQPKGTFAAVDPVGWTGGTGLIFIDSPTQNNPSEVGTGANEQASSGTYLPTYYSPTTGIPSAENLPGNYVEADGNPNFESGFNYTVTGLVSGTTYTLSFYQAASQQVGFSGSTTNQWIVALGTAGLTDTISGGHGTYHDADATASIVATPLMNVPSEGIINWNYVTLNLTADSTTDVLSFLAWGNNGSTANEPPMAFLSGVNSPPGLSVTPDLPEPVSLSLFGVGLAGLGMVARRRRRKRSTSG